ncbi:MAG: hypothetical protein WBK55_03390 [Alphaproteobacteria bacterium]
MPLKPVITEPFTIEKFNALSFEERCQQNAYEVQTHHWPFFLAEAAKLIVCPRVETDVRSYRTFGFPELTAKNAFRAVQTRVSRANETTQRILELLENNRA